LALAAIGKVLINKMKKTEKIVQSRNNLIEPLSREPTDVRTYPDRKYNSSNTKQSTSKNMQTLAEFSNKLGLPAQMLIEQFQNAGVPNLKAEYLITESNKSALLNYLRAEQGISKKPKSVPIYEDEPPPVKTQVVLADVNDELLFYLAKNPELIYELGSRKFEELIAKLFVDRGHEVSLTKSTRDGGYDIFAKIKDAFSEFIILAECKKYSPDNKVGVEIVRGLYGVTEVNKANQGLIITSSFFTKDAQQEQLRIGSRIGLKDYNDLVEWLKPYSK
jgi:restriction system protein